jgi:hypothetical protein
MGALRFADVPRGWRIAWVAPLAVSAVWCVLLQPESVSPVAPLLGPWAGRLYGHEECTMATALPGWSLGTVTAGVVLLIVYPGLRPNVARLALAGWIFAWSALATMSVVNMA